jgi:hypothetical protein
VLVFLPGRKYKEWASHSIGLLHWYEFGKSSLSEKEVGVKFYAPNFKGALLFSHFFVLTSGSGW